MARYRIWESGGATGRRKVVYEGEVALEIVEEHEPFRVLASGGFMRYYLNGMVFTVRGERVPNVLCEFERLD